MDREKRIRHRREKISGILRIATLALCLVHSSLLLPEPLQSIDEPVPDDTYRISGNSHRECEWSFQKLWCREMTPDIWRRVNPPGKTRGLIQAVAVDSNRIVLVKDDRAYLSDGDFQNGHRVSHCQRVSISGNLYSLTGRSM